MASHIPSYHIHLTTSENDSHDFDLTQAKQKEHASVVIGGRGFVLSGETSTTSLVAKRLKHLPRDFENVDAFRAALLGDKSEVQKIQKVAIENLSTDEVARKKSLVENGIIPLTQKTGPEAEAMHIKDRMSQLGIRGCCVAVIDTDKTGNQTTWSQGYGELADTKLKAQAASISKTITALTVLSLVDEGKIDLDTDVSTLLDPELWKSIDPENLAQGIDHKVTIRRLLSHTAGISVHGFGGYKNDAEVKKPASTNDILQGNSTNSNPIRVTSPPGSGFDYSGGGTTILQKVIEEVTKEPFEEAATNRVLNKLGMKNSGYSPDEKEIVIGYEKNNQPIEGGWHVYPEKAAAGLWSTAEDLAKVVVGIQGAYSGNAKNPVISQKLAKKMLSPQREGHGAPNGLGIFVDKLPELPSSVVFHHSGENHGYRAVMIGNNSGQGVAIMTNSENGKFLWKEVALAVAEAYDWPEKGHLMMAQPEFTSKDIDPVPPDPINWGSNHQGTYYLQVPEADVVLEIFHKDGKAFAQVEKEAPFELIPLSETLAIYRQFEPGPWEVLRIEEDGSLSFGGETWLGKWMSNENVSLNKNRQRVPEKYWSIHEDRFKKIAKTEEHLAHLKKQKSAAKKGKAGRAKKDSLNQQITLQEERLTALHKPDENLIGFLKAIASKPEEVDKTFAEAVHNHDQAQFYSLFKNLNSTQIHQINHFHKLQAIPEDPLSDAPITLTNQDVRNLQDYMRDSHFSGVIVLSDGNAPPITLASSSIDEPLAPFAIHSIGKLFTGVLVLRLIEDGVLNEDILNTPIQLDENVIKKLPLSVQQQLSKTTLLQVMLHRGGYGDYLENYLNAIEKALREDKPVPKIERPEDFLPFADKKLAELGPTGEAYSNLGLLLVGLSVQHLCQKPFQQLLEQYVLKPAKVETFETAKPGNAYVNPEDPLAPHIAGGPAGGYWCSAEDLLNMGHWLREKGQDEAFLQLIEKYGGEFYEKGEFAHGGSIDSSSAHLSSNLKNGFTMAIMSNKAGFAEASLLSFVIQRNILPAKGETQ